MVATYKKIEYSTDTHGLGDAKHSDVVITSVANGQLLGYDSGTSKWINLDPVVSQSTRTNLKCQPEREDGISSSGSASPNAAGVLVIAGDGTKKIKVFDAGYVCAVDGLHCFYFGTTTTLTTKRFCTMNKAGVIHQSFVHPRVSDAGNGLYLYASVNESGGDPFDYMYVQE
jgi:hypothetical protein